MNDWQDYADVQFYEYDTENAGILIGNSIVCDGYQKGRNTAIFSHYHGDHIKYFEKTLTTCDTILSSPITHDSLVGIFGKHVAFRQNFQKLPFGQTHVTNTEEKITLYPSNHIPGSAQIYVETHNGTRILYSGDFNYPGISVPKCDILVLDASHGDPQFDYVTDRKSVLNRIFEYVADEMLHGNSIVIKAHRGTMQLIMQNLESNSEGKTIPNYIKFLAVDPKDSRLTEALSPYLEFPIRPVLYYKDKEALKIKNENKPYILFRSPGSTPTPEEESMKTIMVDGYSNFKNKGAVFEEDGGLIRVNFTSHASFSNILKYVKDANPKLVITDKSRSSYGTSLATQINQKLGIAAFPRPS